MVWWDVGTREVTLYVLYALYTMIANERNLCMCGSVWCRKNETFIIIKFFSYKIIMNDAAISTALVVCGTVVLLQLVRSNSSKIYDVLIFKMTNLVRSSRGGVGTLSLNCAMKRR